MNDEGGPYEARMTVRVLMPNSYDLFGAAINVPNLMTTIHQAIVHEYGAYECNVDIQFIDITDQSTGKKA